MGRSIIEEDQLEHMAERFAALLPKEILPIIETLIEHNKDAYIVGGAVRDFLLGLPLKDFDISTNALPSEMIVWFREKDLKVVPTGSEYGTILVVNKKQAFDVSTYRKESFKIQGQPPKVEFVETLTEDLKRRDFQINCIAFDPVDCKFIDELKILEDLNKRIIRTIGSPLEKLMDDGLRIIRLARFISQLSMKPEEKLYQASMKAGQHAKFRHRTSVRIEMFKLLGLSDPTDALVFLFKTKTFPRIFSILSLNQNSYSPVEGLLKELKTINSKAVLVRLYGLIYFLSGLEPLSDKMLIMTRSDLDLTEKQFSILKRINHSWIKFPATLDLREIKKWVRATGLVTSRELLKLILIEAAYKENDFLLKNEEYLISLFSTITKR
ncbi:MAG: hypothetical protein ACTSR2_01730 [Candidatus Hodarchaeales archaeon]